MTPTWVQLANLAAAVMFILALKGLSSPKAARRGVLLGAVGAVIATIVVFFSGRMSAPLDAAGLRAETIGQRIGGVGFE